MAKNPCVSQIHDSYFRMLLALHRHISTPLYSPVLETLSSRIAMCGGCLRRCVYTVGNIFTTHRGERPGIQGSIASQHFSMESHERIHPFVHPAILAPSAVVEIAVREANLNRLRISYKAR